MRVSLIKDCFVYNLYWKILLFLIQYVDFILQFFDNFDDYIEIEIGIKKKIERFEKKVVVYLFVSFVIKLRKVILSLGLLLLGKNQIEVINF